MFSVNPDSSIKITRGDTGVLYLSLRSSGSSDSRSYEVQPGDEIVLTVKASTHTPDVLIQKQFDEDMQVKISPEDTSDLSYGTYYYDVQLTNAEGDVFTVVTPHKFEVLQEVTW